MTVQPLKDLHTALIDAREGYAKAIAEAENTSLRSIFEEADDLHRRAHADIHRLLAAHGDSPDDDGSFMGDVHKAVISVRSAVTGLGPFSLSSFASGEERIIEHYDEAIVAEADSATANTLSSHKAALEQLVQRMKGLADG